MKGSSFAANVHNISFSPSLISSNHHDLKPLLGKGKVSWPKSVGCAVKQQKGKSGIVVECGSCWGMVREVERELEGEIDEEKGKGKSGMTRFREKCGERKGAVELLECLEKEAIMGDDVGKEANDYNRRA